MDKSYKRAEHIDDKIKDIRLTYNAWRTLFLVDEDTSLSQISDILQEEIDEIDQDVQNLISAELILEVQPVKELLEEKPEVEQKQEEKVPEAEELVKEDPAPEEELSDASAETEQEELPAPVLEPQVEELAEEIKEMETVPEEIKLEEEPVPETEKLSKPDEPQTEPEKETVVEEDIEINIHDEQETETALLDVDFADETVTKAEEVSIEDEAPTEQEPEALPEVEPEPQPVGNKTVLVIDDSIVIRKMVEIALENEDLIIQTAVSGKDGLDKIDQLNPSLVILDLMLPDINGIDILKTIKASKKIPVIMLSGKDSPQMVEQAKETGADAFLPKPFKDDELIEQIKSLLEG